MQVLREILTFTTAQNWKCVMFKKWVQQINLTPTSRCEYETSRANEWYWGFIVFNSEPELECTVAGCIQPVRTTLGIITFVCCTLTLVDAKVCSIFPDFMGWSDELTTGRRRWHTNGMQYMTMLTLATFLSAQAPPEENSQTAGGFSGAVCASQGPPESNSNPDLNLDKIRN